MYICTHVGSNERAAGVADICMYVPVFSHTHSLSQSYIHRHIPTYVQKASAHALTSVVRLHVY